MTESKLTLLTTPWDLGGIGKVRDDLTVEQDAGRAAVLFFLTVMAKESSSQKLVPLTSVDPTLTYAKMVAGAIGGTGPEFAANSDAEFAITVDGVLINVTGLDMTGLDTEADTPGYYTCGTNGAIIAAGWDAVTDGAMTLTVNGVAKVLAAIDFTDATTFDEVVETLNFALQGHAICTYDADSNIFKFTSPTTGETSVLLAPAAGAAGTDISAAGYLNGAAAGAATPGTGGEGLFETISEIINAEAAGRFTVDFDGDAFVFYSPTPGLPAGSITVLTAVVAGAGTDISGAAFLNGLTGVGTVTAATGNDGTDKPAGILMSNDITAAALVAGDVDDQKLLVGSDKMIDEDMIILENSLTLASVVVSTGRTIREELELMGIYPRKSTNAQQIQPI